MISEVQKIAEKLLKTGDYESSVFWFDKILIMSDFKEENLYSYIDALIRAERHSSALSLLKKFNNGHIWMTLLMGQCYAANENCPVALDHLKILTVSENDYSCLLDLLEKLRVQSPFIQRFEFLSHSLFLKGSLLEYSGNIESTLYYSYSLICCPLKFAIARKLIEDSLLNYEELSGIINMIRNFNKLTQYLSANILEDLIFQFFKLSFDKKVNVFSEKFSSSWDVRRWHAQKYLDSNDTSKAIEICKQIMIESDYNDMLSAITYAKALFEGLESSFLNLFQTQFSSNNKIFYIKSILMYISALMHVSESKNNDAQAAIQNAVASNWNAVIRMQPWCLSPSVLWMLQGHSSWSCGDHENAIASFVAAADAAPGLIWPWFCVGVLHSRHSQHHLAIPFLNKSMKISKQQLGYISPLIINEVAVCLYHKGNYQEASSLLEKIISHEINKIQKDKSMSLYLSSFYLNLANCQYKMKYLTLAIETAQQGLCYNINHSNLMRLIGYLHDMIGQHENAQLMYHRSLILSPQLLDRSAVENKKLFDFTIVPPDSSVRMYRQQDLFSTEMLKWSAKLLSLKKEVRSKRKQTSFS